MLLNQVKHTIQRFFPFGSSNLCLIRIAQPKLLVESLSYRQRVCGQFLQVQCHSNELLGCIAHVWLHVMEKFQHHVQDHPRKCCEYLRVFLQIRSHTSNEQLWAQSLLIKLIHHKLIGHLWCLRIKRLDKKTDFLWLLFHLTELLKIESWRDFLSSVQTCDSATAQSTQHVVNFRCSTDRNNNKELQRYKHSPHYDSLVIMKS